MRNVRSGAAFKTSPCLLCALIFTLLLLVGSATLTRAAPAQAPSGPVIVAEFDVPVDPGSSLFVKRVVEQAVSQRASAIVIYMNTPGGLLSDMVSIISSITEANQSGIPTYTYVPPNGLAASAGSYIAMACNKILMGPGSAIGPSTPIVVGGSPLEQNHTQAAMLELLVGLAEKWGRNATAATKMVQSDQAFSVGEAVKYHVIDGTAGSLSEALIEFGLPGVQRVSLGEDLYEQFISTLSNSVLDGVLMLVGIMAIVLDLQHGTILLSVVGAAAIITGLIGAEVISASVLGFFIIALAAFLIIMELRLGHGFSMMAGVAIGALGIFYLANGLTYSPSPITGVTDLVLFGIVVVGVVAGLYFRWVIGPLRHRRHLTGTEALIGQTGEALTDLKPEGDVRVGGYIWRARSVSGDISKGQTVRVRSIQGLTLEVEKG